MTPGEHKLITFLICRKPCISSIPQELYIIRSQNGISSSRRKYTLMRDEIQRRRAAFDDIHTLRCDDKKAAAWIKKSRFDAMCS